MPKPRDAKNKGFPTGWRLHHGAIYYNVPKGLEAQWDGKKLFRLGKTPSQAYKVWADKLEYIEKSETIGDLLDRYLLQVTPEKAPATQGNEKSYALTLRKVFGPVLLDSLLPQHIYKYVDKRMAKVSAKREIALLSHAYTKAVEWGYINRHPFKGEVRLAGEKPRERIVEQWEIDASLGLKPMRVSGSVLAIQAYMGIKLITGIRRVDILRIKVTDAHEDGIAITPSKTKKSSGKTTIYKWTPSLRAAWNLALKARPVDISPWLFCNKFGKCYLNETTGKAHGWDSMWGRFMDRVIEETAVTERFTESDMRSRVADNADNLDHARALLSHADTKTTSRVYRRKPEMVEPLK